ncbi:MAG: 50S ribosomal protein L6 [Candidatus Aenigmarchaeota archaeon]|nr:50S ribosomal protein L6 [Candidatus Aenigmarchaeota archaeon]
MKAEVAVPEGIDVKLEKNVFTVKGKKGELKQEVRLEKIKISVENGKITVESLSERRKEKALVGTYASLLKSMCIGVTTGYQARLKVVYSHFPIKVSVEGRKVLVQNFLGKKSSRQAELFGNTEVKVSKDEIIVTGIDKKEVGQTAANIERSTKISGFDRRVFQDGIYLTEAARGC